VLLIAIEPVSPQGVYVDYRKCTILLVGYLDTNSTPLVVNELVLSEEEIPARFPSGSIEPSKGHDPAFRIMRVRARRPWPNCVWMEKINERISIKPIPSSSLEINDRADLVFDLTGLGHGWFVTLNV